jgi:hypothetical protein
MSNAYDFGTVAGASDAFNIGTMAIAPNLSPPPSALAPPQSVLSLGRDQASQDFGVAAQQAQQDVNQERQLLQQQRGQLAPFRQAAMQSASQPIPQPPEQKQAPKPPTAEDAQQQTWQHEWLTAAMFLGALGGALTRRPLTNSLAAFTGMVEGYNEGNKQKFDQSMKTWEAENKRVLEANNAANKAYDQILKSRELDFEQKKVMLQLKAMELKDDAMAQAAVTGHQIDIAKLFDTRVKYGADLQSAQTRRDEEQQQRAVQWVNSNEGQQRAKAIAEYRLAPPSTLGRTGYQGALNTALMDKVLEVNPDYNVNQFKAEGIRQTTPAAAERAGAMSRERTLGAATANTELNINKAGPVVEIAAEAANAVPATAFKRINELYQAAQEEIGDPAIRRFKLANEELAMIYAAVLNPRSNVVTVSAQEHARKLISASDSPEAYQTVLENIKRLAEREAQVVRETREGKVSPINVPPISPNRQGNAEEMVNQLSNRASAGVNTAVPNAQKAWEDRPGLHPPDWVPRLPKGWLIEKWPWQSEVPDYK